MSAYPQFGPSPTLTAPQLLSTGGSRPGSGGGGGSGSPDPVNRTAAMMSAGSMAGANPALATAAATTQSPYSPYSPHGTTALLHAYGRLPAGFAEGMYGAAAAAAAAAAAGLAPPPSAAQGLYQLGADPAAFYVNPITGTPYDLKDNAEIWRNLAQPGACLSYDPTGLGYGYGYGGIDLSLAARRKNATKENTSTLKAWLQEHKKNPYPTKGEKIMLAIITKMTLTQVSTWFANARRRLKKENKMTWSPKSKDGEHSDDDADADNNGEVNCRDSDDDGHGDDDGDNNNKETNVDILGCDSDDDDDDHNRRMTPDHHSRLLNDANHQRHLQGQSHSPQDGSHKSSLNSTSEGGDSDAKTSDNGKESGVTNPRPRIWSLDDVLGETRSISPNAPSADASVTSGLSYPLPLKPTATSLGGLQHTAASLRHWAERSPYQIPVSLAHYGIPTSLNLSTGVPTISTPGRPVFSATSLAGLNSATGVPHPGSGHPAFQPHSGHYPHNLSSHPSSHHHPHHPHHPHHHPGAGPLGSLATHPAASGSLLATVPNHISKSPDSSTISHSQASRHNIGDRELPKYTLDSRGLPVTSHSSPESLTAFRPVARSKPSEVIKA